MQVWEVRATRPYTYAGEAVVKRLQDVGYGITDTSTLENLGKQEVLDPLV